MSTQTPDAPPADPSASDAPALFLEHRRGPRITETGMYTMSLKDYHRDPVPGGSLSSTGARRLLPPGSPARFDYDRRHGRLATPEMDLGTAIHSLLFGGDPEIHVIDAPDRRTKKTKQDEEDARADGMLPMLQKDYDQACAMVDAVRRHPEAGPLFEADDMLVEQSLFWRDRGIMRRARPDEMFTTRYGRRILVDYKSCHAIDDRSLSKAMYERGWHQQAPWYEDGAEAVGLGGDGTTLFVFVCQEKTPPYFVRCFTPDADAMRIGRDLNELAIGLFRDCTESGDWPTGFDTLHRLPLPGWVMNAFNWERW